MELAEKERLMLDSKKEEILKLTKEILDALNDPEQTMEIKKRMTSILSLLSTIASYAESKNYNLDALMNFTNMLFLQMDLLKNHWTVLGPGLELFCNTVNNVRFNFTKRDIKIRIPKVDFSIFKQSRE